MDGATRTVGVEEELLLVDPLDHTMSLRSAAVRKVHEQHAGREPLDHELFLHQLETRTDPSDSLEEIRRQLAAARRSASVASADEGLAVMASGIVPLAGFEPQVSPNERYRDMVETFGYAARTGSTCGTHVHVAIRSPEEGVGIIDRIVPWLPLLVAIGANSPFAEGQDTKYASWRQQAWTRWPSAGATEAFRTLEGYRESARLLLMTGAASDEGMLYYDARLSRNQPTVEIRVVDACADLEDTVLAAALVRALTETAAEQWAAGDPVPRWRSEILRGATWRASRMGLSNTLVDPMLREQRPAREVLERLVRHVRPRLEANGDLERVTEGVDRVMRAGGATRQRAAFESTGTIEGVVDDLIRRTAQAWEA